MAAGVSASRRSVVNLIIAACLVAVSCSDHESPTSPVSSSSTGKATISGTLLVASDSPAGGASGAGQPLANATVRVASTGQAAQTDAAGNFTLAGVSPGAVALEIRGAGVQASATINASPAAVTKVTLTVSRGRSTVSLAPRSHGTEGIVDSIPTASSFVLRNSRGMVVIQTDAATRFRMRGAAVGFADLKVGQRAEVEGSPQPDGSILAAKVEIQNPEQEETRTPAPSPSGTTTPVTATPTRTPRPAEVEVEGTVASINGTSFVLMTRSGPVTIQTNPATLFRSHGSPVTFGDLTTGEEVEVKGARQADGSVLASRVDIEEEDEEGVEREGTVASISGTSFVLMTGSGPVTVQTNSATRFRRHGDPASFADIHVGGEVEAEGALQADGSLLASRVSIEGD
jgi:hypothetical protein